MPLLVSDFCHMYPVSATVIMLALIYAVTKIFMACLQGEPKEKVTHVYHYEEKRKPEEEEAIEPSGIKEQSEVGVEFYCKPGPSGFSFGVKAYGQKTPDSKPQGPTKRLKAPIQAMIAD